MSPDIMLQSDDPLRVLRHRFLSRYVKEHVFDLKPFARDLAGLVKAIDPDSLEARVFSSGDPDHLDLLADTTRDVPDDETREMVDAMSVTAMAYNKGRMILSKKPSKASDNQFDDSFFSGNQQGRLSVPVFDEMHSIDRDPQLMLTVDRHYYGTFTDDELEEIRDIADLATLALEAKREHDERFQRKMQDEQLRTLTLQDALHGIKGSMHISLCTLESRMIEKKEIWEDLPENVRRYLRSIQTYLKKIDHTLRSSSRFLYGKIRRDAYIDDVLDDYVKANRQLIADNYENKIALLYHPFESSPDYRVDAQIFKDFLDLLVNNAAEACTHEGHIVLYCENNADDVRVYIGDDCGGMSDKEKAKVFTLGESTKEGSGHTRGIGGPSARYRVELHGGTLEFHSLEGYGTCFCAKFPKKYEQDH